MAEAHLLSRVRVVCCACGALTDADTSAGKALPDDVFLCADCAQRLSPEQVERLAHDVRLRGVPL